MNENNSTDACAEGWGLQLKEWLDEDEYRHYARLRLLDKINKKFAFKSFLDVGCGSGRLLRNYKEKGVESVGLELAKEIVKYHAGHRYTPVVQGGAQQLPFISDAFDFVTCLGLIEHLPDPQSAITELFRVTKPGGMALITVPNMVGPFPFFVPLWYLSGERYRFGWKNMVGSMYTRGSLKKELEFSGWVVESVSPFKGSSLLEWAKVPFNTNLAEFIEGNMFVSKLCGIMLAAVCRKPS